MFVPAAMPSADTPAMSGPDSATPVDAISFHDVLHALNPLQYVPVVGTIYRAITGDTLNGGVQTMGSMLVSGLMGGPVGLAVSAGISLLEHVTDFNPDAMTHGALVAIGVLESPAETPQSSPDAPPANPPANPCGSATAAEARAAALAAYDQTLYSFGAGLGHA